MQSATERRQLILEYISDHRRIRLQELMDEFQISDSTARRDVQLLSCSHPIITVQGNGGGIQAMDGWYLSRRYLHEDQEALLRSLLPGLQPSERDCMQRILAAFAKPKKEKGH